jgi:hypothetical protein
MYSTYESSSKCNILQVFKIMSALLTLISSFFQVLSTDETFTMILIKNQIREFTKVFLLWSIIPYTR